MTRPKKVLILTDGDADGVCAAAIAKTSYPKAGVKFTDPYELPSILGSLSGYDLVIITDLGINLAQKAEVIEVFRKLSKNSDIIYIDHHVHPPGVTKRSLGCKAMPCRTDVSTTELAWEFFNPSNLHDFIAVLGAIGDYQEKTPRMQRLVEKYGERQVYPEAIFLDRILAMGTDSFKRRVIDELTRGRWPLELFSMIEEAGEIVRRQRALEKYVQNKAEKICEHVMLVRDVPFGITGPAARLLTKLDNTNVGIASHREGNHIRLSMRRHVGSNINLASLIGEITSRLGGSGGGHEAAAGGRVPVQRFNEFIKEVKRALTKEKKILGDE